MHYFLFKKNIVSKNKGFTLIELMVSISIFMSIMLLAMGSLIVASDGAKQAKALRIAMDNVNFAMENMSRSVRMGKMYYCGSAGMNLQTNMGTNDCPLLGGSALAFWPADTLNTTRYSYEFTNNTIKKCTVTAINTTKTCVDIISPQVQVTQVRFYVNGSSTIDTDAPSVYMIISGAVTVKNKTTTFAVQTMATQRNNERNE